YKVKEITVFPGKRLSLQKHAHRSEYWVVVKGEAIIQVGDVEYNKKPGESIFIPAGEKHRLTNKGDVPVVIIETQTGAYLGEDDIVRLEDDFNRV
ncbi:MAG TPA: phosphomannose isomerase type II C-terminal cupin domain, partial [bacterium]|nr:phosphomannose isomerase type II C-terminal cupin domain [bacterium]